MKQEQQQTGFTYLLFERVRIQSLRNIQNRQTDTAEDTSRGTLAAEAFEEANNAYKKGDFEGGLYHYGVALKHQPQSHEIHNNIGVLRALSKEFRLASESLRAALSLKPSQSISIINLANVHLRTNEFAEGIALYLELMQKNNSPRAEENFNRILKRLNSFKRYYQNYFNSCLNRKYCEQSKPLTRKLLDKIATQTPILLYCNLRKGDGQQLKHIFQKFLSFYNTLPYSALHDIYDEIEISKIYSKIIDSKVDHHLLNIAYLILSYHFNYKNQPWIGLYFFSLIDKYENTKIKESYRILHQNFNGIKRQLQFLNSTQNKQLKNKQMKEQLFHEFKKVFDRFQIYQKLVMFWFHQHLDSQELKQSLQNKDKVLSILSQIKPMHYLSDYYDLPSDKTQDKFKDTFKMLIFNIQPQISIIRGKQEALKILNQIISSQYNLLSVQKAYQQKCFLHFRFNQIPEALETLQIASLYYPQSSDIWDFCYGSIYLSTNNLQKSILYFQSSLKKNSMNEKSNFSYACICIFLGHYKTGLRYLFHAISLNPSDLQYYFVLALCYDKLSQQTANIKEKLHQINKSIPKNIEFKVKGNIAYFQLYTKMYDQSYQYLCKTLQQASNQIDFNGQDLSLIYYYRMILQIFYVYHSDDIQCLIQCSLYLLILKNSHVIRQRYINLQSQENRQQLNKQMSKIIQQNLGNNSKRQILFKHIIKCTDEHKRTIYHYIFELILEQQTIDPLDLFEYFITVEKQLSQAIWVLEIQSQIKQSRIQSIMRFIAPSKLSIKNRNNYLFSKTQFNNLEYCITKLKDQKLTQRQIIICKDYYRNLQVKCKICRQLSRRQKCIYGFIHKIFNKLLVNSKIKDEKNSDDAYYNVIMIRLQLLLQSLQFSSHEISLIIFQTLYKQVNNSSKLMHQLKIGISSLIEQNQYFVFKQSIEKILDDEDNLSQNSPISLFDGSNEEFSQLNFDIIQDSNKLLTNYCIDKFTLILFNR